MWKLELVFYQQVEQVLYLQQEQVFCRQLEQVLYLQQEQVLCRYQVLLLLLLALVSVFYQQLLELVFYQQQLVLVLSQLQMLFSKLFCQELHLLLQVPYLLLLRQARQIRKVSCTTMMNQLAIRQGTVYRHRKRCLTIVQ